MESMPKNPRVTECVEGLCRKGCTEVRGIIDALESKQAIPETEHLTEEERAIVLGELKAIMAVYDR